MTEIFLETEEHGKRCKCLECRPVIPLLKVGTKAWKTHLKNGWSFLIFIEKEECYVDRGQQVSTRGRDGRFSKYRGHLKQVLERGLGWIDNQPKPRKRRGKKNRFDNSNS